MSKTHNVVLYLLSYGMFGIEGGGGRGEESRGEGF